MNNKKRNNDYFVNLRRRSGKAVVPVKAYRSDAGFDLVCIDHTVIWPFQVKDLDTGWDIKVPYGFWGSIKTRSSTFTRRKLLVLEGVLDPAYTGCLSVAIFNPTFLPKIIKAGERLAQLMICRVHYPKMRIVFDMPNTERGDRGYGSTDKLINIDLGGI